MIIFGDTSAALLRLSIVSPVPIPPAPVERIHVPYDPTAAERAAMVVAIHRERNFTVHGLSMGLGAFTSVLAFTLAKPGETERDIDAKTVSAYGCSDPPVFVGLPMFLHLGLPTLRVDALVGFEVAALGLEDRNAFLRRLAPYAGKVTR